MAKKHVSLRLDGAILAQIDRRAKAENRSRSQMIELMLSGGPVLVMPTQAVVSYQQPLQDATLDYSECQSEADLPRSEKAKRLADVMSKFPVTKGLR